MEYAEYKSPDVFLISALKENTPCFFIRMKHDACLSDASLYTVDVAEL